MPVAILPALPLVLSKVAYLQHTAKLPDQRGFTKLPLYSIQVLTTPGNATFSTGSGSGKATALEMSPQMTGAQNA